MQQPVALPAHSEGQYRRSRSTNTSRTFKPWNTVFTPPRPEVDARAVRVEAERQKRQRASSEQQAEPRSAREVVRNTASTHYASHTGYDKRSWRRSPLRGQL